MRAFIKICEYLAIGPATHPFYEDIVFVALDTEGSNILETLGVSVLDTRNIREFPHSQ